MESCEERDVLEEEVGVSEGEDGGVVIFWTYVAGTNPCFPFNSTFHQSCVGTIYKGEDTHKQSSDLVTDWFEQGL